MMSPDARKTIIRRKRKDRFTIVDNRSAEDENLSYEALGLLTYLLSRPDDWQIQIDQLKGRGGIGKHKIRRIVKELSDAHYMAHERYRDADSGAFIGGRYTVYDEPQTEKCSTPVPVSDGEEAHVPLNRDVADAHVPKTHDVAQQEVENQPSYLIRNPTKEGFAPKIERDVRTRGQESPPKSRLTFLPPDDGDAEERFQALLKAYPAGAIGSVEKARAAFLDLDEESQKAVRPAVPRILRGWKDEGRDTKFALATMLKNRDWERFPQPTNATTAEPSVELKPYVVPLWAMLWGVVDPLGKSHGPASKVEYFLSRIDKGLVTPANAVPNPDLSKPLVPITIGSAEHAEWVTHCERLGFRLPKPDAVPVVYVPSKHPPSLSMHWKGYRLAVPRRTQFRSMTWWSRVYQPAAPIPDILSAGRRQQGTDLIEMGPWPAAVDLVGMIEIKTLTDRWEAWATWFASKGAAIELWPESSICVPSEWPPAIFTPEKADATPDYDALEGIDR